ncbi:hypothetical protein KY290_013733 [Solanum tuberosum]|uniref:Retrotransposon gag protein n=1 Tax=Solanum tuberosum TaxID=4113 RepID=A0ABQ7VMK0_SOLTU|nr:hypothetical protein KY289_013852 [Solanum tuberosum]KAH0769752.1 hypothetical protein KY290_013733 [Solanum tuberosum]
MGDQIQHQLAQLVNLFQEERVAYIARHEAINARLDALTKDLANSKVDSKSIDHTSQNRGWKGKRGVAEGSKSDAGGSSFIPRPEIEERRLKELCFNCDEPFTRGHQCKKLFWIDSIDDEEEFVGKEGNTNFRTLALKDKRDLKEESNVSLLSYPIVTAVFYPQLVSLLQEERAANITRQEAINARSDALIKDLANSKVDSKSTDHTSQNRGWKGKRGVAEGSKSDAGGSSFIHRSQKLGELVKLCQIGSMADYQEKFEQLISRADLPTTMSLSRIYERKEQSVYSQSLDACKSKTTYFLPQQHAWFEKKLTRPEIEEMGLKGLCFNCDEPFTRGHQCKKLFWIDSIDDEEEFAGKEGNINFRT